MKRRQSWVSLIVLGVALSTPSFVHASTVNNHPETNKLAQNAANVYNKQLRKTQKQQAKAAKKNAKMGQKLHPEIQHH